MSENLSQAVLGDRYVLKVNGIPAESTWSEVALRVARGAAKGDPHWVEDAFRDALENMLFIPGGRQLAAVGAPYDITPYNCFVLSSPEDSRHGILDSLRDWIEIQSRGGGVGINMSSLRPRGSVVRSVSGTSSGPLAWMELFSTATHRVVQQGGSRRGAAMLMLDDSHPDIFEFIDAKRKPGILLGANLSVAISDGFMRAVRENDIWDLKWNDHLFRSVPARELWDAIISSAWASGEPGVVFLERANKESNSAYFEKLIATNPCFAAGTLIATTNGPQPIETLVGQTPYVYSWSPETNVSCVRKAIRVWRTRKNVPTMKITLDSGMVLRVTPDHNLFVFKGCQGVVKVQAKDIVAGMQLKAFGISKTARDGRLRLHDGKRGFVYASRAIWEAVYGTVPDGYVIHHRNGNPSDNDLDNLVAIPSFDHQADHYNSRVEGGFGRHGWKTSPEEVHARISQGLRNYYATKNHKVVAVEEGDPCDVYNLTVEGTHTVAICDPIPKGSLVLSGIMSPQCSEQPLGANAVCLLGSVNLLKHIKNGSLDEGLLAHTTQLAVRFMDNVIDRAFYPSADSERVQKSIRRMGLGTIGLADALVACGLKYGSAEAVVFTERVFKLIKINSYLASVDLAREKGAFPAFDAESYLDRPFIRGLASSIRNGISQYGIRNCFLTSQAPTGSIAKLAGVWSGIEPYFDRETFVTNRLGMHKIEAPDSPYVVLANELTADQHLDMMAAAQRHIDSAVSKTVNAPHDHTLTDTEKVYSLAYDKGLKSVAYYRDNSRTSQIQWHSSAEAERAIPEWEGLSCADSGGCEI